ncbi:MAG: transposase [Chloroflexi bacterium]|nr:transposase [Chloroflexota bacterium]
MIVRKAYQFKLEPTPEQARLFRQFAGATRWVYNHMLTERRAAFKAGQKTPTTNEQINQLPILKQQDETAWLKDIHSQVLQDAVLDLDDAFARFFSKQNGYPKFKKKNSTYQSFSYPQGINVNGNHVWLPKIGWVKFRRSHKPKRYREIEGTIKRATVKYKASGWYVSLNCEVDIEQPDPVDITPDNSIGIDLVTTSDGEKFTNPRHYRKLERKLKREQRKLSRKQPGSNNRLKQKQKVARLHERIANRRKDTLHKLSRQLIDENQAIFCENLNVKGMAKGNMGKSVGDAAWSELVRQLKYKAQWAGKPLLQVGRFYASSQLCSACQYQHTELAPSERRWTCPNCGVEHDRDINGAINIHTEGLKQYVAAGLSETLNACGETVRPAKRARLAEARISRL